MNYGFVIDNGACIGCHACSTACKSENEVPVGVHRTWVKVVEAGRYPDVRRSFQVTRCNHCANPPCVRICPVGAMYQLDNGIVEFDTDACIGCKACMQACPYDAIYLDPETRTAAKCHFCSHRVEVGLEPACVVVCPEHAIIAGDLDDPTSEASRKLAQHNVTVRKPEQGTAPKVFYIEGNDLALHPEAQAVPETLAWADVVDDPHTWSGHVGTRATPARQTHPHPRGVVRVPEAQGRPAAGPMQVGGTMAEHMVQVAYTSRHRVQWHWPIPVYIVTKHIAAGIFVLLAATALIPGAGWSVPLAVGGGLLAHGMLAATLALLVYDLDRPDRFFYLLVRPQWRSWVARAAWILTALSVVAGAWWAVELAGWWGLAGSVARVRPIFALATLPLGLLAATYTAFLFAQAEGRDLWQNALIPALMTTQAVALGAGSLALLGARGGASWLFGLALVLNLTLTLASELGVAHPSELARRASREMTHGHYARAWWGGGVVLGHLVPLGLLAWLGTAGLPVAVPAAAVGVFAWAWAFVMAPQTLSNS